MSLGIEAGESAAGKGNRYPGAFSRFYCHLLEASEFFHGTLCASCRRCDVHLDNLGAVAIPGVAYVYACSQYGVAAGFGVKVAGTLDGGLGKACAVISESSVTEAVAEGELYGDALGGVPAVAYEYALVVILLPPFLALFLYAGVLPVGLERAVGHAPGEGEREPARGIDRPGKYVRKGMSALGTAVPPLHYGVDLVRPRHGYGRAGDVDHYQRGHGGCKRFDYLLDNEELKAKACRWVEAMISSATTEGYFGNGTDHPYVEGLQRGKSHDWWPKMVALKILQQYYEATADDRVLKVLDGYFRYQLRTLPEKPLVHWTFWAEWRAADNLQVIYWLYNQTGASYLLDLAELIHNQTVDFTSMFWDGQVFRTQNSIHCVNLAQGFKTPLVWWQQSHSERNLQAPLKAMEAIRTTIGFPIGLWAGDELLHFGDPSRGSELCTAVEMMYSLEEMLKISGDIRWADWLERVAYNALPTQASDDYLTHQYFQQVNQIACTRERRNFVTEHYGTDNVFGLLNGYPCCACNMHQGWPKFTRNLWYAARGGGLVAMLYAPCTVTTDAGGKKVTLVEDTFYPFDGTVRVTVRLDKKCSRVQLPLEFRIPSWCREAAAEYKGKTEKAIGGTILKINEKWKDGDTIVLSFPMDITTSQWYDRSTVVERGPLVYALKMNEVWTRKEFHGADREQYGPYYYEVTSDSRWNYGLRASDCEFSVLEVHPYDGTWPWSVAGAPVILKAKAVELPDWKEYNGSAGPVAYFTEDGNDTGGTAWIELIPYGCTTLRIAEFPTRR